MMHTEEEVLAWISIIHIFPGNTRGLETLAAAARGQIVIR